MGGSIAFEGGTRIDPSRPVQVKYHPRAISDVNNRMRHTGTPGGEGWQIKVQHKQTSGFRANSMQTARNWENGTLEKTFEVWTWQCPRIGLEWVGMSWNFFSFWFGYKSDRNRLEISWEILNENIWKCWRILGNTWRKYWNHRIW